MSGLVLFLDGMAICKDVDLLEYPEKSLTFGSDRCTILITKVRIGSGDMRVPHHFFIENSTRCVKRGAQSSFLLYYDLCLWGMFFLLRFPSRKGWEYRISVPKSHTEDNLTKSPAGFIL